MFVSGCSHGCKGCYNESTWNPDSGIKFTKELEDQIIADLQCTKVKRKGISISGGDPLHSRNLGAVFNLIQRIRTECPGKDVWLWTGYTLEEIEEGLYNEDHFNNRMGLRHSILGMCDVFIDGKFVQELADPSLKWRGSSNQNIYKVDNGLFKKV